METVREYFVNSSLHGLHFIAEKERHWTERLFWVVCVLLAWTASFILILGAWDSYQHNAISFVVDTSYKDWNTPFPSVTFCEIDNSARTSQTIQEFLNQKSGDSASHSAEVILNLQDVFKDIGFYKDLFLSVLTFCTMDGLPCPTNNLIQYANKMRSPCGDVFYKCYFRDKEFDCCEYFLPLETEYGNCYSLNNLNVISKFKPTEHRLDTFSNMTTGPGFIYVQVKSLCRVAVTDQGDVVSFNTPHIWDMATNRSARYWFTVMMIANELEVQDVSIEQRKCRFPHENPMTIQDIYSSSACIVDCRLKKQLELCNCTNYMVTRADPATTCDLLGMVCIYHHRLELSLLKNRWGKNTGIFCPECFASCTETELEITRPSSLEKHPVTMENQPEGVVSTIEVILEQLPTSKYKRIVIRGKLDLVVSMGGTAGLFVGASILSFVELVYYFTVRLYNTVWLRKQA